MRTRTLGTGNLEVSAIGLGCMSMSFSYGPPADRAEMIRLNIGFVPFSPLGKGLLTGAINEATALASSDFRASLPRFTPEARKANYALVDLLTSVGARKGATAAQIALAWVLAQKTWMVPIPGTTKAHRLDENVSAAAIALTTDDLREIEDAASRITIHGAPYPDAIEKMTGL